MNKKYLYYNEPNRCMAKCAPEYIMPEMGPEFKLATAYVPFQKLCNIFEPMEALCKGTLFPELYDGWTKC